MQCGHRPGHPLCAQVPDGVFRNLAQKQEALLAADKASVAADKAAAPVAVAAGAAAAPEDAAAVAQPSPRRWRRPSGDKGPVVQTEKAEKPESAPMMRLFAMQADQAVTLVLMCTFSAGACALSTYTFYLLAVRKAGWPATCPPLLRRPSPWLLGCRCSAVT